MPTVAVSPRDPSTHPKVIPPPFSLGSDSGNPHLPLSETHFQECPNSLSPNGTKRPLVTVTMDSGDDDHSANSDRAIHGHKRQKNGKSQVFRTQTSRAANGDGTVFRQLQEQREQLPIARGGSILSFYMTIARLLPPLL
jgi:hypothetical protein